MRGKSSEYFRACARRKRQSEIRKTAQRSQTGEKGLAETRTGVPLIDHGVEVHG